jgi:hypothetical protein
LGWVNQVQGWDRRRDVRGGEVDGAHTAGLEFGVIAGQTRHALVAGAGPRITRLPKEEAPEVA